MNIKYFSKTLGLLALCFIFTKESKANLTFSAIDSIGVEINNGKQVVLHRLEAKESYYSLSRKYTLQPKEIMAFNNNKALKIGDIIKIPINRTTTATITNSASNSTQKFSSTAEKTNSNSANNESAGNTDNRQNTQYRVSSGETLYAISKRFQIPVNQIVKINNLKNEQDIKVGQLLNIPQGTPRTSAIIEPPDEEPLETEIVEEKKNALPANRYGLKQIDEKGVGVWMDGLNSDGGNMLALHKTAPVGTVVKITNPMTQKTTFAKIVGKYNDNSNTRDAVIVISKTTANLLGILDKRFLINISYGMPN